LISFQGQTIIVITSFLIAGGLSAKVTNYTVVTVLPDGPVRKFGIFCR